MEEKYKECLIHYPNPSGNAGSEIRRKVQKGRTSLRFFLGDDRRCSRLFEETVNDDRIVALQSGNDMIGYAAFFVAGRGPLSPRLSNFLSEYRLIKGGGNFLLFKATEPRVDASELYIYNINVRSMHRGKGAGGALVDAVSNLAVSMGCRSVRLQVATHNRAMILYLKKGFVVTGAVRTGWLRRFFPLHRNHGVAARPRDDCPTAGRDCRGDRRGRVTTDFRHQPPAGLLKPHRSRRSYCRHREAGSRIPWRSHRKSSRRS